MPPRFRGNLRGPWASSRSARGPDTLRPAASSSARTRRRKRGCVSSRRPAVSMSCKTSSTAGACTTTRSDHTRRWVGRLPSSVGQQPHPPLLAPPSPGRLGPAFTACTRPVTSAGATTSSASTAGWQASESSSSPETSTCPSTGRRVCCADSPSTPAAATKAPASHPDDAVSVSDVLTKTVSDVPRHHKSPWQRGSNENTNGLLRQYLPRRLDLRTLTQADFDAIAQELNERPRQTLGFKTPSQALAEVLR